MAADPEATAIGYPSAHHCVRMPRGVDEKTVRLIED
jgi:hypothetical protein